MNLTAAQSWEQELLCATDKLNELVKTACEKGLIVKYDVDMNMQTFAPVIYPILFIEVSICPKDIQP